MGVYLDCGRASLRIAGLVYLSLGLSPELKISHMNPPMVPDTLASLAVPCSQPWGCVKVCFVLVPVKKAHRMRKEIQQFQER